MIKLSTGQDSTLGNWRANCVAFFSESSPATKFLDQKIADSPNGSDEEVWADENQMIYLLGELHFGEQSVD